jgi:hypothetical protein
MKFSVGPRVLYNSFHSDSVAKGIVVSYDSPESVDVRWEDGTMTLVPEWSLTPDLGDL